MALNTGHDGALSTVHANSPEDALRRIETLALMAGVGLPHEAIREQLAARHRPGRPPGAVAATARAAWSRSREVVRTAGSVGGRARSGGGAVRRRSGLAALIAARRGGMVAVAVREALLASPAVAAWLARGGRAAAAASAARAMCRARGAAAARGCSAALALAALALLVPGPGPLPSRRRPALVRRLGGRAAASALPAGGRARGAGYRDGDRGRDLRRPLGARRSAAAAESLDGPSGRRARAGARPTSSSAPPPGRARRHARAAALGAGRLARRGAAQPAGGGGDVAALMRRLAAAAAERDRVDEEARAATTQARFTGLLVVALPAGAALFAELLQPGLPRRAARRARLGCCCWPRPRPPGWRLRCDPAAGRIEGGVSAALARDRRPARVPRPLWELAGERRERLGRAIRARGSR